MSFVQHTINKHTRCFQEEVKCRHDAEQCSLLLCLMGLGLQGPAAHLGSSSLVKGLVPLAFGSFIKGWSES